MKIAKLTLMFLACAAAIPAFAQNTTGSLCGTTNYNSSRNVFTITNPTPGTQNQQCFINVLSKQQWAGGAPILPSSTLVEGNYRIELSGGNGGGGYGSGAGANAAPSVTTVYLKPGVYRMTIGQGGAGGVGDHWNGWNGAPTSLSNANSNETIAGFARAEYWDGPYSPSGNVASGQPVSSYQSSQGAPGCSCDAGTAGDNGFIKMAFNDPVPQAAPAETPPPAPAAIRPARRDRN